MEQSYKKIGIGYESYKRIIDDGCYYVDKTQIISDIIKKGSMVTLFTRPRRFGKTLALSTLRTFFELEYDFSGEVIDKPRYFAGKKIMDTSPDILDMMGRYPVINLSLKSAKQDTYRTSALCIRDELVSEITRHDYLASSDKLSGDEKQKFKSLLSSKDQRDIDDDADVEKEIGRYSTAIKTLSELLAKHHGMKTIILIDEYDVPLENAYHQGFYDKLISFIRSIFESALKTNDSLEFAVVTGCLRISRESIFTGLNNLEVCSIRSDTFNEAFGFNEAEVCQMLKDYGISDRLAEAKEWYNGYLFGDTEIYNPWSVTKYIKNIAIGGMQFPEPYWANTSSNDIIREMVYDAGDDVKRELDELINGGTIEKRVHEDITYDDIHESEDNLWNFLFFTGYMKKVSERFNGSDVYVTMKIPNKEIWTIYRDHIRSWFEKNVKKQDKSLLHKAVLEGDTEGMENFIRSILKKTISTFDSHEGFYHGFFLSLLYGIPNFSFLGEAISSP